jgi:uncharacterized Ntn-hydrolase superfamily protein
MTFSIAARCGKTGEFGVAISSSSICVASRCAFTKAAVGASLSQNITDPRLGPRLLELCAEGLSAQNAIQRIVTESENIDWRQLGVVDAEGKTACYSGSQVLGVHASAEGHNCVAIGNLLANSSVPSAMVDAFDRSSGKLAERLMLALEAGSQAGGEAGPIHSAGLQVSSEYGWPTVDLRVDWEEQSDIAIRQLRHAWFEYEPQVEQYIGRAIDPARSESYGVPGDE